MTHIKRVNEMASLINQNNKSNFSSYLKRKQKEDTLEINKAINELLSKKINDIKNVLDTYKYMKDNDIYDDVMPDVEKCYGQTKESKKIDVSLSRWFDPYETKNANGYYLVAETVDKSGLDELGIQFSINGDIWFFTNECSPYSTRCWRNHYDIDDIKNGPTEYDRNEKMFYYKINGELYTDDFLWWFDKFVESLNVWLGCFFNAVDKYNNISNK